MHCVCKRFILLFFLYKKYQLRRIFFFFTRREKKHFRKKKYVGKCAIVDNLIYLAESDLSFLLVAVNITVLSTVHDASYQTHSVDASKQT